MRGEEKKMGNKVEDVSLEGTKAAYLNSLSSLNVARTHYETSGNKSEKLLEDVKFYELMVKNHEEKLRRYGINPEDILCKKSGSLVKPAVEQDIEQLRTAYPI